MQLSMEQKCLHSSGVAGIAGDHEDIRVRKLLRQNLQFSTEITVYLGNGTRYALGCYGSFRWQIGMSVPMTEWP